MNWWAIAAAWVAADVAVIMMMIQDEIAAPAALQKWADMGTASKFGVFLFGLVAWPFYVVLKAAILVLEMGE